jgi:hypothetical protein
MMDNRRTRCLKNGSMHGLNRSQLFLCSVKCGLGLSLVRSLSNLMIGRDASALPVCVRSRVVQRTRGLLEKIAHTVKAIARRVTFHRAARRTARRTANAWSGGLLRLTA